MNSWKTFGGSLANVDSTASHAFENVNSRSVKVFSASRTSSPGDSASNPTVDTLLRATEGPSLEFKRVSGKMVGKALETLCAFANTDGGILVLGLADPSLGVDEGRIFGIEENMEAVDELRRKVLTHFEPAIPAIRWDSVPIRRSGEAVVHLLRARVERSEHVHSILGDGTWIRLDASNRQMSAREITELSYRRGDRSAESETMPIDCRLLDTATWRVYMTARGFLSGDIADQLLRVGLAERGGRTIRPRRAAVLLFADEPGGLLAVHRARCDVRLLVYRGSRIENADTPNLRKQPRSFRGPLISLIDAAVRAVEDELAEGLTLAGSGFETTHRYPMRVVKEAIVNAVIHRDYRLNRDVFVRIFDNRIEIESPGALPGAVTTANIATCGSKARNPLIARALFDFPVRPNIDAGEGVRMMFAEMEQAGLYPPQYRESSVAAGDLVTVTLLNAAKPPLWEEVSDWIDRNGAIANVDLCRIGRLDTLKASRQLRRWVEQGVLQVLPDRGKRNTRYRKPSTPPTNGGLLSEPEDNNGEIQR